VSPEPTVRQGDQAMRGAALAGFRVAIGVPLLLVSGGMLGFGALAHDSGFASWEAVLASVVVWALPAQVVATELHATGADLLAIAVAAALTSMRFFPMAVALLPTFGRVGLAGRLAQSHLMSATSWAFLMRSAAPREPRARLIYHTVFGLTCITAAAIATLGGWLGAAALPQPVALGLLFMNAAFFMVLLIDQRNRQALLAVASGTVLYGPIHAVLPEMALLLAGVLGGSVAFLLGDRLRPRA